MLYLVSHRIGIPLGALTRNAERAMLIGYAVPLRTEVLAAPTTDRAEGETGEDLNRGGVTFFLCFPLGQHVEKRLARPRGGRRARLLPGA